jgi:DNA-directed RNA polymerase subunit RPC12/RpoP
MSGYRETNKSDWIITIILLVFYIVLVIAISVWLAPQYMILSILLGAIGLLLLVLWHNRTFAYRCSSCGNEFEISALLNFFSPHGIDNEGGWKYLKCPSCKIWRRARVIKKL